MTDTYLDVMKGIIAKLKATSAVTDVVSTRIYSDVPQAETFPYIVLQVDSANFSTKTFTGMDHTIEVHVYSKDKSPKEVGDARKAIVDSLNRRESAIALDNGAFTDIQYETGAIFKEPDGVVWHGVIQFRAIVT